jgi:Asp-tRNA(Asn)/Glu-tRNA(Gln) amidotransferase C subunit
MDKRLERLEKDNALLVSTLRIIAGSFDVLNRLLPEGSDVANQVTKMKEVQREGRVDDRDVAVEVLMNELQKNANRVSRNSGTSSQRMRLEGSDDEGGVIKPY